mmetsp:Transcript_10166/g.15506  ORF Transcript_10166/g.15506 Transcript_10166/m.15506 type:complete len:115 (+) Transcript_10166:396-740(+)
MYVYTMITALLYSYLIVRHYLDNATPEYRIKAGYSSGMCGYNFPCLFFYSRFNEDLKGSFASTNFIFVFCGFFMCLYLWLKFDKKAKFQAIFQTDGIIYSRLVMNSWAWSTNNK